VGVVVGKTFPKSSPETTEKFALAKPFDCQERKFFSTENQTVDHFKKKKIQKKKKGGQKPKNSPPGSIRSGIPAKKVCEKTVQHRFGEPKTKIRMNVNAVSQTEVGNVRC